MKPASYVRGRPLYPMGFLFLAGAIAGCGDGGVRNGEIFLVTASGASDKLGLVEVFAVPKAAVTAEVIATIAEQQRELDAAEKQVAAAEAALKQYRQQMKEQHDGSQASFKREKDDVRKAAKLTAMANEVEGYIADLTRLTTAAAAAKKVRDEAMQGLRDLWESVVASPTASAKTDSNGAFAIPRKKGEWVCAYTTRTVDEVIQHFVWVVGPDQMPGSGKLLLSNDNLVALPGK